MGVHSPVCIGFGYFLLPGETCACKQLCLVRCSLGYGRILQATMIFWMLENFVQDGVEGLLVLRVSSGCISDMDWTCVL